MSAHAVVAPDSSERSASRGAARSKSPKSSGSRAIGGEPRVSLLPAEVNDFQHARTVRRRLGVAVIFVILLVLAGLAAIYYFANASHVALQNAQNEQAALASQELEFTDLRAAQTGISLIEAGQFVGASTEIDWATYLESLAGTLPDSVIIKSFQIDSANPFVDYAQSSTPLEGSRVATLVFTASSPGLPSIPAWLDGLGTLKGFADAVPGSVNVQEDGSYLVNITMHINSDAFALRFPGEGQK